MDIMKSETCLNLVLLTNDNKFRHFKRKIDDEIFLTKEDEEFIKNADKEFIKNNGNEEKRKIK